MAAGILTYEAVATICLSSGALYFMCYADRRRALREWGIDLMILGAVLVVFTFHAVPILHGGDNHEVSTLSQMGEHVRAIGSQSATLLARSLLPFGTPRNSTVLVLFGAIVVLAVAVASMLPRGDQARRTLLRWLTVATVGVLLIGFGYIAFVPSNIYYVPLQLGLGNRVNGVATIGYALVVYAAAALVGTLVFRGLPRSRQLASALTALIIIVIGVGYLRHVDSDTRAWNEAGILSRAVLATLRQRVPHPAPGGGLVTFDAPTETAPGVSVFEASWDLNGAAQLLWNDQSLRAYPMGPGMSITCTEKEMGVNTGGSPVTWKSVYTTDLVDVATSAVFNITNQSMCVRAATQLGVYRAL